jgi:nucleoid-associated protein YgaU
VKNFLKNLKLNESNVSMLLGVVVVLIVGGLLVNYFRSVNQGDTSSTDTDLPSDQIEITQTPRLEDLPSDYNVQEGDSLWKISEEVYGSGYNWGDVYEANKEALGGNPNNLAEGTKITLPKVEPKELSNTSSVVSSEPTTVTVEKGDHLWGIAMEVCNNGYAWSAIARDNNIANGNLIEVGQELKVVCQ